MQHLDPNSGAGRPSTDPHTSCDITPSVTAADRGLSAANCVAPPSGESDKFGGGLVVGAEGTSAPLPAATEASHDLDPGLLLQALWPTGTAVHQLAYRDGADGKFRNVVVRDIGHAMAEGRRLDAAGADVYIGCAEYRTADSRKAENSSGACAFWADVDCGADKAADARGYLDPAAASVALSLFCAAANLPEPTHVVASGGGLHLYWAFKSPMAPDAWQAGARSLKALFIRHGFLADPSRTADIASVLRMPGTSNRKLQSPRPVSLVRASTAYLDGDEFIRRVEDALERSQSPSGSAEIGSVATHSASDPPPDVARLTSALACIDPDCDEETWKLRVIAPMAGAARGYPDHADELKDLAKCWSSGELQAKPSVKWMTAAADGRTGAEMFDAVWNRFLASDYGGKPTTLGTVFHLAREAGWEPPPEASDGVAKVDADDALVAARETLGATLTRVREGDAGAPLEAESIAALAVVRAHSAADYHRLRSSLKRANSKVSLAAIDAAVDERLDQSTPAETHHGYARALLKGLTVQGHAPVSHDGALFVVDPASNLWRPKSADELARLAADRFDGAPHCQRRSDYQGVAQHTLAIASSPRFFEKAPVGIACPDGLIYIEHDTICRVPLTAAHRQRVSLGFSPVSQPTPLFDKFLHETFQSAVEGEEAGQIRLAQEIAGAIMVGLTAKHHKAVLLYDPYGRAGKGTFLSILEGLVPAEYVTAVSPFKWDREYYVAGLSGSRLNVVGELQDSDPIPAAPFKTIIGRDRVTGRNPAGRPFSFQNEATHVFMSNHLINTRDHTEAFFARWLLLEFPNSRLKLGLPLDADLAARIIASEMPGIAHWALEGARRLLRNRRFSTSMVHDRLMARWRRSASSVEEFIHEECELSGDTSVHVKRSEFYSRYRAWCAENGRKPYSKAHVKELLEHNVKLGVRPASLNGYEIFRGLAFKAASPFDEL